MSEIPSWLLTMRTITGVTESPGEADNPKILAAAQYIGNKYPEMESYCDQYNHDSIAWCGLTVAYVMAANDIRPQFETGGDDVEKFLWAQSWLEWGQPCMPIQGCVMIFTREGGGHVTLLEEVTSSGGYKCRGGNQSDAVNVQTYTSGFLGARWPLGYSIPGTSPGDMPMIEEGDTGPAVMEAQRLLCGLDPDGDFGPATDAATKTFQLAKSLEVDGVIGPASWEALYEGGPLTPTGKAVCQLALDSPLAGVSWRDRGKAPMGYIQGMALVYHSCYHRAGEDSAVDAMCKTLGSADKDVLKWYEDELEDMDWPVASPFDRLRALFAIQIGLGMRESSGRFCEGRDMSASNTSSETAEAGLFQTSWNAKGASKEMQKLFEQWEEMDNTQGCRMEFGLGVEGTKDEWNCYGSGDGKVYQAMSKVYPQFHTEFTAIGMRYLRQHWGPINRREVELRNEAYDLLIDIEALDVHPPEPPVEGDVDPAAVAAEIVDAIEPTITQILSKYRITRHE